MQAHNQPAYFLSPHCQEVSHFCLQGSSHARASFFPPVQLVLSTCTWCWADLLGVGNLSELSQKKTDLPCQQLSTPYSSSTRYGTLSPGIGGFSCSGIDGFSHSGIGGFSHSGIGLEPFTQQYSICLSP